MQVVLAYGGTQARVAYDSSVMTEVSEHAFGGGDGQHLHGLRMIPSGGSSSA